METAYIFDSVRVMYIAFIMIYGISGLLNATRWRFFRTNIGYAYYFMFTKNILF